ATTEMCYGVGMIFGPAIGGLLNQIAVLSPTTKGGIFVISGALYAGFNQVWAYFAEKMYNCHPLCIIGCISSFIAFIIVGPMPFFPMDSQLWLAILGQVFLGLGMGGQFVGSFVQGLRETFSAIGPALGGILMGAWGYRMATVPIAALQLFMVRPNK
ncbi:unnamed protein product, partial [Medioppia subpectinata]